MRGVNNYDPDLDYYNVYYKRASSLAGLRTAPEHALPTTTPPLDNAQRDVSALQSRDGTIWVFTSTGLGPGSQRSVYYYTYTRGHWSGPTAVPGTDYAAHVNAVENHGAIWVFFDVGYSLYAAKFDNGVWQQTPTLIATDATLGKGIVDDGTFYVVWAHVDASQNVWGDYIGLSTSRDGKTWKTVGPIAKWPDGGLTNWDPVIIKDKNSFRLFWAPSDTKQFIATSTSKNPTDAKSWSAPLRVTTASSGSNSWWDFWPEPIKSDGGICLFYTSERNSPGTGMSDGNIWMLMAVPLAHV